VRACGNLIVIDEDTENVQLAHYTVQQYLLEPRGSPNSSTFYVVPKEAEIELGKLCVAYLSFNDFKTHITKFVDNATPTITAMEKAIGTQSLIPQNSNGTHAVKAFQKIRGKRPIPSDIKYGNHITRTNLIRLKEYYLLPYILENWLLHSASFECASIDSWYVSKENGLLQTLAFENHQHIEGRPWDSLADYVQGTPTGDDPCPEFVTALGWALTHDHGPLLEAILINPQKQTISWCLNLVVDWVLVYYIIADSGIWDGWGKDDGVLVGLHHPFPRGRDMESISHHECWQMWLYCQILKAFVRGNIVTAKFLIGFIDNVSSMETFYTRVLYSHAFLEAVRGRQASLVEFMLTKKLTNGSFVYHIDGCQYNAIEVAALAGFGDIMDMNNTATAQLWYSKSKFVGAMYLLI